VYLIHEKSVHDGIELGMESKGSKQQARETKAARKNIATFGKNAIIFITTDNMRVILEIDNNGKKNKQPISREAILEYLKKNKVTAPVEEKNIKEALGSQDKQGVRSYSIIEEKPMFPGEPRKVKVFLSDKEPLVPELSGHTSREESRIHDVKEVKKGDLVGEETAAIVPQYGTNIFGIPVPAPKLQDNAPSVGRNITVKENKLYSSIDGTLILNKQKEINILPVKVIEKSLNKKNKPISFDGALIIKGGVRNCNLIKCSLLVCKTLEGTNVKVDDDVIVLSKITDCTLESSGSVYAKKISTSELEVSGDVMVSDIIEESNISSGGKVVCSKKGIYKSNIRAKYYVDTRDLGEREGKINDITVGMDNKLSAKVAIIGKQLEKYNSEIGTLQNKFRLEYAKLKAKFPNKEIEHSGLLLNIGKTIKILKREITILNNKKKILLKNSAKEQGLIYLRVRGKAFPGNSINTINSVLVINATMKGFKAMDTLVKDSKNPLAPPSYDIRIFYPSSNE